MAELNPKAQYVYQDTEVRLTSRTAIKRKTTGRNVGQIATTLYEITPADDEDGSWKKWVRVEDLYEIIGTPNE